MSGNLTKTKRRIASVTSTQKITKAMGMIASVKTKRNKDLFDASSLSSKKCFSICSYLFSACKKSPYFIKENEGDKCLYIIITSDLGLCGGYNSNLFRHFDSIYKQEDELIVFGNKGKSHYHKEKGFNHSSILIDPSLDISLKELTSFASKLLQAYKDKKYSSIKLVHTRYLNSLSFLPSITTILPMEVIKDESNPNALPPLVEPTPEELLNQIIPLVIGYQLKEGLDESKLAEQSSRRNAMDAANDNADELLNNLKIEYNKARQTSITQEIVEVVSGSVNA